MGSHIDWGGAGGCDKTLFGKTVELFKTLWTDGECSKPEVEVGVITLQACQKKSQDEADCSHIDWGGNSCRENMFKQVMSKGNSGSQKCKCFINKKSTGGCGNKSKNHYMTQQKIEGPGTGDHQCGCYLMSENGCGSKTQRGDYMAQQKVWKI